MFFFFFFQAEDGIRDYKVTGVQTCALPISKTRKRTGNMGGAGSADISIPFRAFAPFGLSRQRLCRLKEQNNMSKGIVKDIDKGFYEEARQKNIHPLTMLTQL